MAAKASDDGAAAEDLASSGESPVEDPIEEAEIAGDGEGKRRRGRKRKSQVEAEEKVTVKKERKQRSMSKDVVSPIERPSRERKTVERFIEMSPRKVSASKVLSILQGPGTKLKDIPNVSFKLSKRKVDENLQVLHTILFGRKSNVHFLKRNIVQFSGFVWTGNEEKQRTRVREKLDKCKKDRLLDFCELLDIHINRTATKKEDITEKLLEFLKSPHATRDVVLAEKKEKKKRKRRTKGTIKAATDGAFSENETQEHKTSVESELKKGRKPSAKANKEAEDEDEDEDEDEAEVEAEDGSDLAVKEDDENGSAEKENVHEGVSSGNKDTSGAKKNDSDTEEESGHVKVDNEEDEDEPEEPLASNEGSIEKKKAIVPKNIKEKDLPVKIKGRPASKKNFPASEDLPSKKISSRGQPGKDKASLVNKRSQGTPKNASKSSSRKKTVDDSGTPASLKTKKDDTSKSSRKNADDSDSGPSASLKTKKNDKKKNQGAENTVIKEDKAGKRQSAKSVSKMSTKGQAKGKAGPKSEELHSVISDILKEVDFNTATLADILKKLGAHFDMDLTDRKAEVKQIIEDIINNMTDDEDGEGDEGNDDSENAERGEDSKD